MKNEKSKIKSLPLKSASTNGLNTSVSFSVFRCIQNYLKTNGFVGQWPLSGNSMFKTNMKNSISMKYFILTLSIFCYNLLQGQAYKCQISFDKDWKPLMIYSPTPSHNDNNKFYYFRNCDRNEHIYYRSIYLTENEISNYRNFRKTTVSTNKPCQDFFGNGNNKMQGFAQRLSFMGISESGVDSITNQGYFVNFNNDGTVRSEYYERNIVDKYSMQSFYISKEDKQYSYFQVSLYYRRNSIDKWSEPIRIWTGRTLKEYRLSTGKYFMSVYLSFDGDGSTGYYSGVSRKIKCGIKGEEKGEQSVIISKEDFFRDFQKEYPDLVFIPILMPLKFNISESDLGTKCKDLDLNTVLRVLDEIYLTDQECWVGTPTGRTPHGYLNPEGYSSFPD